MKRKGLLVAFLLLLALIVVVGGKKEILTATGQTVIRAPAANIITGFGDTSYWSGFLGEVPQSVINIAPGRFIVSMPGTSPSPLIVNVFSVGKDSAMVVWIRKLTIGGWAKEKFSREGPVQVSLAKLKTYAENPKNR